MSVETKSKVMSEVIDYMSSIFDGDMDATVEKAFEYVEENDLVTGIWDSMGHRILRVFFLENIRNVRNEIPRKETEEMENGEGSTQNKADNQAAREESPHCPFLEWHYSPEMSWKQLGDMTMIDCLNMANYHGMKSKQHANKREFFRRLQQKLDSDKTIQQAYTEDELNMIKLDMGE